MIEIAIPGRDPLRLQHLVTDVNGTLALDGVLIDGVAARLATLRDRLNIHLLTADTLGRQAAIDQQLGGASEPPASMAHAGATRPQHHTHRLTLGDEQAQKQGYVKELGAASVIAIGQGANDALMLKAAGLGICVMSAEGAAPETLLACDILVPNILAAFDLLDTPMRIVATLRK